MRHICHHALIRRPRPPAAPSTSYDPGPHARTCSPGMDTLTRARHRPWWLRAVSRTVKAGGLGLLAPDTVRTILVVGDDGELAVALRDRVDRAYALVKDVRPPELTEAFATCLPWPWMVAGSLAALPGDAEALFRHRPILVLWRGDLPSGLPRHTRRFDRFADMAAAIITALTQSVAGMRMAIGLGVELPGGGYARSAELQALVSAHPHSFDVPLDAFRSAVRVLSAHRIEVRPARDPRTGAVALTEPGGCRR
jgi:hypothetical protein